MKQFLSVLCLSSAATLGSRQIQARTTNRVGSVYGQLNAEVQETRDDVHIVFTTGCTQYQNWQSENLLYSWARVQQPGRITRIVAGCKSEAEKQRANKTAVPNDDERILWFFVKDYGAEHDYHYFNKPFGTNEWIQDQFENIYENLIVHLDPDMIILKPFLFHIQSEAKQHAQWQHDHTKDKDDGNVRDLFVREGHSVCQLYGIGPQWVHWKGFCDDKVSCQVSEEDAWKYYSVGPPYIMHKNDWAKLAPKWMNFSTIAIVVQEHKGNLAEMYAFSIASAFYDLKHEMLFSMMSHPGSMINENAANMDWSFLGTPKGKTNHQFHILHFCQSYYLGLDHEDTALSTINKGGWSFRKRVVPPDVMSDCNIPLLVELDDNDRETVEIYEKRDRLEHTGNYWMLYHVYKYLNEAIINYRLKYCNERVDSTLEYKLVLGVKSKHYVIGEAKEVARNTSSAKVNVN